MPVRSPKWPFTPSAIENSPDEWGGVYVLWRGETCLYICSAPDVGRSIKADLLAWGLGTVSVDGQTMATCVPVHVMAAQTGLPGKLELDVGDPAVGMVPSLPNGHLRVTWSNYAGSIPGGTSPTPVGALGTPREIVGALILIVLVAVGIALNIGVPAVVSATGRRTEP